MASGFAFSFGGEDIEDEPQEKLLKVGGKQDTGEELSPATAGAFPVAGKSQLSPLWHSLDHMLSQLPSKIAYSTLNTGDGTELPRRELWDVKVQVMAENDIDAELEPGLGSHDVKTGVYEGGFKSWESSVDLVKELRNLNPLRACMLDKNALRVVELGCGTALPSLALFQAALMLSVDSNERVPVYLTVADYNPTVLQLVTLPNFILTWALVMRHKDSVVNGAFHDDELELLPEVIQEFKFFLFSSNISLSFLSGGWSDQLIDLLFSSEEGLKRDGNDSLLLLGAETIYSPFALSIFTTTMLTILRRDRDQNSERNPIAIIGAKRHYFGVGGSLDDFVEAAQKEGCLIKWLREESQGVRRGVVQFQLP